MTSSLGIFSLSVKRIDPTKAMGMRAIKPVLLKRDSIPSNMEKAYADSLRFAKAKSVKLWPRRMRTS